MRSWKRTEYRVQKRRKTKTKTIKIADSSIAGRRATAEYVKNPMVSDSENEKRI